MATGNIPASGMSVNDLLTMIGQFSGQNSTLAQRTQGSQNTQSNQATTQATTGTQNQQSSQTQTGNQTTAQTTTGGNTQVQTTRSDITQEGLNRMLQMTLEADNGIASIFSGQNAAGGYGSTVSGMLASDLIARTAGELARLQAGSTVTTTGQQNQTVTGLQQNTQSTTGSQNTQTNQNVNTNVTGNQTQTSDQQVNQDRRADAPLDIGTVLAALAGGTVLGPSIGAIGGGLGNLGQDIASIIRSLLPGGGDSGDSGPIPDAPGTNDAPDDVAILIQDLLNSMSNSGGMLDGLQSEDIGF